MYVYLVRVATFILFKRLYTDIYLYIIHRLKLEEESGKLPAICRVLFIFFFFLFVFLVTKILPLLFDIYCAPGNPSLSVDVSLLLLPLLLLQYIYIFFFFCVIAALSWLDCPSVCPSIWLLPFRFAITLTTRLPTPLFPLSSSCPIIVELKTR